MIIEPLQFPDCNRGRLILRDNTDDKGREFCGRSDPFPKTYTTKAHELTVLKQGKGSFYLTWRLVKSYQGIRDVG